MWVRFPDEAVACPGCASPRIRLLGVFPIARDAKGRRVSFITGCKECGLLFSNPLRTRDELERYYSREGPWAASHRERTQKVQTEYLRTLKKNKPPKQRARRGARDILLDALAAYVPLHAPPPGAKALDFGCGDGKFLDRLQRWGWQTFGIEPSTDVAFLRHPRLEAPPQDASCDLVILHHVLEHVADPLGLLRQLAGAVREDGRLFVSVPRLDTLGRHGDLHYCLNGRTHIMSFSETCLESLLARAGFAMMGRLDERLDDVLTEGQPLRLRVVAMRTSTPPSLPRNPLAPAVRALREYASANGGAPPLTRVLPVRVQAALMDRARERGRGTRGKS